MPTTSESPAAVSGARSKLVQLLRMRLRQLREGALALAIGLAVAAMCLAIWWLNSLNGLPDIGDPFDVAAFRAFSVPDERSISDTNAKNVDISVRMKAVAGQNDQGGGLVWRAKDKDNYYVARNNPLSSGSYNVYKVVDGKRTIFKGVPNKHAEGWHTLRVTMKGDHIECYHDGKKYLEVQDSTLPEAGKIGLWSKSDAHSEFDNLTLITPRYLASIKESIYEN
jgi:hypothetical protein